MAQQEKDREQHAETAAQSFDIEKSAVEVIGTVTDAKPGYYVITCLSDNDTLPGGMNISVSDYFRADPTRRKAPELAMRIGGDCTLVSKEPLKMGKFVDVRAFPAGTRLSPAGDKYNQFSDDQDTAVKLASGG